MRSFQRTPTQTRPIQFDVGYTSNADASVLVCYGNTKVICTASFEDKVPPFLRNAKQGWITAEYGMLPGSTHTRSQREAAKGKQSGRTVEIGRLIGRSLRTCIDLEALGERSVTIDCDVIQADGGTRTASITGGCVALIACLHKYRELFDKVPLIGRALAVSLGRVDGQTLVDLDYDEDSRAQVDLNLIMDQRGRYIEIQGTAEGEPFEAEVLAQILSMGRAALTELAIQQAQALAAYGVESPWVP
jgi:ribonuclease PH